MTKLEAVNHVLREVGLAGTVALDTDGASNAAQVERILDLTELEVQTKGWHYNTRRGVTLARNGDDSISLPNAAITIDGDDTRIGLDPDVTQVGRRLYNLDDNANTFTADLKVTYTLRFEFDCIPQPIQSYIAAWTAVRYNDSYGRPERRSTLYEAMRVAKAEAKRFDNDSEDVNCLRSGWAESARGSRFNIGPRR